MPRSSRLHLPPDSITADLARRWSRLNLVERGEELEKLIALGFSRRALGTALGWAEGTIRRNLKLAHLPAATRNAIAVGHSAKEVLSAERRGEPLPAIDAAAARSYADERLLDRCIEEVGPWLQRRLPWRGYQEQFLVEADVRLWRLPLSSSSSMHPSSPRFAIKQYRPRRRAPDYGPDQLEYLLEWFLGWAGKVLGPRHLRDQLLARLRTDSGVEVLPAIKSGPMKMPTLGFFRRPTDSATISRPRVYSDDLEEQ